MNRSDAENACNAIGKSLATIGMFEAKSFTEKYLKQRKEVTNNIICNNCKIKPILKLIANKTFPLYMS
jgi:hypothetical protein